MTNETTLHIEQELKPIWDTLLSEIPEPPKHFKQKQATYWYSLCNVLKDRNQLTHRHTVYVANICKTVAAIENTTNYFTREATMNWRVKTPEDLRLLKRVERNISYDTLGAVAHFIGLSITDLKAAGLPIQDIFRNR